MTILYWNNLNETGNMTDETNWSTDQAGTIPYDELGFLACDLLFTGTGEFSGDPATAGSTIACGSLDARDATCSISLSGVTLDGGGSSATTYLTGAVTFSGGYLVLNAGVTLEIAAASILALIPTQVLGNATIKGGPCRIDGALSGILGCSILLNGTARLECLSSAMHLTDSASYPAVLPETGYDGIYGAGEVYLESDRIALPTQVNTRDVTLLFSGSVEASWEPPALEPDIRDLQLIHAGNTELHIGLNSNLEQLEDLTLATYDAAIKPDGLFVTATEDISFALASFSVLATNIPIDIDWSDHTVDIGAYLLYISAQSTTLTTARGDGITRVTHEITVIGTPAEWEPTASPPRFVSSYP
jgi:hypothetical protein